MAHYVFVQMRCEKSNISLPKVLRNICENIMPEEISDVAEIYIERWPDSRNSYIAIQNSSGISRPHKGTLVIGWTSKDSVHDETSDGSYAIISVERSEVTFFTDQFGSRTIWYYIDDDIFAVSTSQRALVQLKGKFELNKAAVSWFLSSGCQGPFMSWDTQINQVKPNFHFTLDVKNWSIRSRPKKGMQLPVNHGGSFSRYTGDFERSVVDAVSQIMRCGNPSKTLLPLSGGLDSRLLLALCNECENLNEVMLTNWGVETTNSSFTDKVAANKVAEFYGKPILNNTLPIEVERIDNMVSRFVLASEGRLDQLNAYADGFDMWANFVRLGYRYILRGDIPYTEGIDVDEESARTHIGLQTLSDYSNFRALGLSQLANLQLELPIERKPYESLFQWRDRLYIEWRVPMVISAFSDIVGGYLENRAPMMSWTEFKEYMALPDKSKGNKAHIEALWRLRDKSSVPSYASTSLRSPVSYFYSEKGIRYILDKLPEAGESDLFPHDMISYIVDEVNKIQPRDMTRASAGGRFQSIRTRISDGFPKVLKGHLKALRPRTLPVMVIAYRVVLIHEIVSMYERDSKRASFAYT